MSINTFIEKWDKRVNDWMKNPEETLNKSLGIEGKYFQFQYMPEPYMGNPQKGQCSFVIVNLNPGQGRCHSWYELKDKSGTLINAVLQCGKYSEISMHFPYLSNGNELGFIQWEENEARKWWKKKEKWIKFIYTGLNIEPDLSNLAPFAMEMNGWHSEKWPYNLTSKLKSNNKVIKEIYDVICEAIDNSQFKFTYCVGKPIGDLLKFAFVNDIPLHFEKERDVYRPISDIKRYYRLCHDGHGHYLVNTWSQGSNSYPSEKFWPIEIDIIQQIKQLLRSR